MVDNFLNEFNQFDLYELLSQVSENVQLRQDLNRRYLSDYVNMVYAAQSDLEFQVTESSSHLQFLSFISKFKSKVTDIDFSPYLKLNLLVHVFPLHFL